MRSYRPNSFRRQSSFNAGSLGSNSTPPRRTATTRRTTKPRFSVRASLPSNEVDSLFEISAKCTCTPCPIKEPNRAIVLERERIATNEQKVMKAVDHQVDDLIKELEQLVKFESVSANRDLLMQSCRALDWVADRLANLNFKTYEHTIPNIPNDCFATSYKKVMFARYFSSPTKNTLLIYGHLDVLPVKRDCWLTNPFEMVAQDGVVYGRGVTSGKGMIIGWLQAIECWIKIHEDLPVNIKFIVDILHEVGSTGLQDYIREKREFFADVDYMIFNVNSWINNEQPIISCSLSGWATFGVELRGANKDLESGLATGLVFQPMVDLCNIMNHMVNNEHEIQIPQIDSGSKRLSTTDWQLLESADFPMYEYREDLYVRRLRNEDNKVNLLASRWCKPALIMHGVQGADTQPGCRQVLPMKVTSKFTIRMVPDQELQVVYGAVRDYIQHLKAQLNVSTKMTLHLIDGADPVSWSTSTKYIKAAARAINSVYLIEPVITSGIPMCLPIANVLSKLIERPILLMPFYRRSDKRSQENESIEEVCLLKHTKSCAALLFEFSLLPPKCKCDVVHDYCYMRGVQEFLDDVRVEPEPEHRKRFFFRKKKDSSTPSVRGKPKTKRGAFARWLCLPFKRLSKKRN